MSVEDILNIDAQVQAAIVAEAQAELREFWRSLPLDNIELAKFELQKFMPYLVDKYGKAAGTAAAEFYNELRADSRVRRRFTAYVEAAPLEAVSRATQRLAGSLFGDDLNSVLPGLAAVVNKAVRGTARSTIVANTNRDPQASGWYRIARAASCNFCVMLSGRGAVYRESTVRFAAHHSCRCRAAPSWDPKAPSIHAFAYEASRRTSDMTPAQLEAHRARVRTWIATNQDQLEAFRSELL